MDNNTTHPALKVSSVDSLLADAVEHLIEALARQNNFADNIEMLQDVTPRDWEMQIRAAQRDLERRLHDLFDDVNDKLAGGEYAM
jgi:hypothetical protein